MQGEWHLPSPHPSRRVPLKRSAQRAMRRRGSGLVPAGPPQRPESPGPPAQRPQRPESPGPLARRPQRPELPGPLARRPQRPESPVPPVQRPQRPGSPVPSVHRPGPPTRRPGSPGPPAQRPQRPQRPESPGPPARRPLRLGSPGPAKKQLPGPRPPPPPGQRLPATRAPQQLPRESLSQEWKSPGRKRPPPPKATAWKAPDAAARVVPKKKAKSKPTKAAKLKANASPAFVKQENVPNELRLRARELAALRDAGCTSSVAVIVRGLDADGGEDTLSGLGEVGDTHVLMRTGNKITVAVEANAVDETRQLQHRLLQLPGVSLWVFAGCGARLPSSDELRFECLPREVDTIMAHQWQTGQVLLLLRGAESTEYSGALALPDQSIAVRVGTVEAGWHMLSNLYGRPSQTAESVVTGTVVSCHHTQNSNVAVLERPSVDFAELLKKIPKPVHIDEDSEHRLLVYALAADATQAMEILSPHARVSKTRYRSLRLLHTHRMVVAAKKTMPGRPLGTKVTMTGVPWNTSVNELASALGGKRVLSAARVSYGVAVQFDSPVYTGMVLRVLATVGNHCKAAFTEEDVESTESVDVVAIGKYTLFPNSLVAQCVPHGTLVEGLEGGVRCSVPASVAQRLLDPSSTPIFGPDGNPMKFVPLDEYTPTPEHEEPEPFTGDIAMPIRESESPDWQSVSLNLKGTLVRGFIHTDDCRVQKHAVVVKHDAADIRNVPSVDGKVHDTAAVGDRFPLMTGKEWEDICTAKLTTMDELRDLVEQFCQENSVPRGTLPPMRALLISQDRRIRTIPKVIRRQGLEFVSQQLQRVSPKTLPQWKGKLSALIVEVRKIAEEHSDGNMPCGLELDYYNSQGACLDRSLRLAFRAHATKSKNSSGGCTAWIAELCGLPLRRSQRVSQLILDRKRAQGKVTSVAMKRPGNTKKTTADAATSKGVPAAEEQNKPRQKTKGGKAAPDDTEVKAVEKMLLRRSLGLS
eukprot:TRINITY_DN1301_c0_g1_i1.p1 TRINITY_DN1301_c0_g1~~TRINITY_DN1301_c0_g1_i1.p1  ORF type:complete len:1043 (+),score=158.21 TRINITY_DN1301_c0_g1_i1:190-3129(+)